MKTIIFKAVISFLEHLGRLPLKVLYLFGNLFLLIEFIPSNSLKSQVNSNLLKIYPELKKIALKKLRINLFRKVGNYSAEIIKSFYEPGTIIPKITNIDILKASIRNHNVTICLSGHFCGIEMMTNISKEINNAKLILVYEQDGPINFFDNWLREKRSKGGATVIPSRNCYKFLLKRINSNPQERLVIGALCDLKPSNLYNSIDEVFFLGEKRPLFNGLERIGSKINANFLYVDISCHTRGHYSIDFIKFTAPDKNAKSLTQKYALNLQNNIIHSTDLWIPLLFFKL